MEGKETLENGMDRDRIGQGKIKNDNTGSIEIRK